VPGDLGRSLQLQEVTMKKLALVWVALLVFAVIVTAADKDKDKGAEKIDVTGKLTTGVVAGGGETTGTIIETKDKKFYELDFGKNKELRDKAEKLNGKQVSVSGVLIVKPGVEVKERRIITVAKLEAAKEKE